MGRVGHLMVESSIELNSKVHVYGFDVEKLQETLCLITYDGKEIKSFTTSNQILAFFKGLTEPTVLITRKLPEKIKLLNTIPVSKKTFIPLSNGEEESLEDIAFKFIKANLQDISYKLVKCGITHLPYYMKFVRDTHVEDKKIKFRLTILSIENFIVGNKLSNMIAKYLSQYKNEAQAVYEIYVNGFLTVDVHGQVKIDAMSINHFKTGYYYETHGANKPKAKVTTAHSKGSYLPMRLKDKRVLEAEKELNSWYRGDSVLSDGSFEKAVNTLSELSGNSPILTESVNKKANELSTFESYLNEFKDPQSRLKAMKVYFSLQSDNETTQEVFEREGRLIEPD